MQREAAGGGAALVLGAEQERELLHHVELWVPDLERAAGAWGWLLTRLGYTTYQSWAEGRSWRCGATYIVVEQSPALRGGAEHDRMRPGLNHLAFHVPGGRGELDGLVAEAPAHGWVVLFPDRHPYAGGPEHCAAYLEDVDGFEVELVVGDGRVPGPETDSGAAGSEPVAGSGP
ncbi:VOC family protein [Streptomyces sp. AF1B]|jgi:catechol 2,3-dioxygenase-like lactoylglutathione lyase family enzyme|uniref:VOC family protein n=1 Tax=Streptomyces sp. AF1B TaxID=3399503 RepID=UPI003AAFC559